MNNFPSKPIKPFKKFSPRNPDYLGIGAFILFFIILGVFVPVITSMFFKDKDLINNFIIVAVICLILIVFQNLREYLKYGENVKINRENQKAYDILMTEYNIKMIEYERKVKAEQKYREELERQKRLESEMKNWEFERQIEAEIKESKAIARQNTIDLYQQKKHIGNIKNSVIFKNQLEIEINNTIKKYSVICAGIAIQPIPFADIFLLTPTQILMGKKIADLRGYEIKENTIECILKEISGVIGLGVLAQQLAIGAYKTVLPFLGGVTTIPVVYGLTYGIGKTMDYYILAKINEKPINKSEIEKIFKSSLEIGKREGKANENEIKAKAKK